MCLKASRTETKTVNYEKIENDEDYKVVVK
jgi:hypothetical protein